MYSCPGPALFCLPIDTATTWHLLPLPVALPLWYRPLVALFGPGSAGWDTVGRISWFCAFLSLERPFGHTHARSPSAYGSLGSRLPVVLAFFSPALVHATCFACFLPRSPGFVPGPRFPLAPSAHARDPEFHAHHFGLGADFGVVCSGTVGLVRFPVWWGAHAAIATVSSSCLIGFSFPGGFLLWGRVREVAFRLRE